MVATSFDPYNRNHRVFEIAKSKLYEDCKSGRISKRNYELIIEFLESRRRKGNHDLTLDKKAQILGRFARAIDVDFDNASRKNIERLYDKMLQFRKQVGNLTGHNGRRIIETSEKLSPETRNKYRTLLLEFYKYILGNDEVYPENVRWIRKTREKRTLRIHNPDVKILSADLIKKITQNCIGPTGLRDRAFIEVKFEGECRFGGMARMDCGDVEFVKGGAYIHNVTDKSGNYDHEHAGNRTIGLLWAARSLKIYMDNHPYRHGGFSVTINGREHFSVKKDNLKKLLDNAQYKDKEVICSSIKERSFNECPLWYNFKPNALYDRLCYTGARTLFLKACQRANINSRVYLHLLRGSGFTYHASIGIPADTIRKQGGLSPHSRAISHYLDQGAIDVLRNIRKAHGLPQEDEEKEAKLKPKTCSICGFSNYSESQQCDKCLNPLDINKMMKTREKSIMQERALEVFEKVMRNPNLLKVLEHLSSELESKNKH